MGAEAFPVGEEERMPGEFGPGGEACGTLGLVMCPQREHDAMTARQSRAPTHPSGVGMAVPSGWAFPTPALFIM